MEFLLEINTEEMPPLHVKNALSQFKEKLESELKARNIDVGQIRTFGTCRRLIVVGNFAPRQRDREEESIGPPKAVAYKADGSPSPAARGFARAQGVKVSELEVIKTERGEYLGFRKIEKGRPTGEILSEIIPQLVSSLSFPKTMRWGKSSFRFSRPIKNILCLFGRRWTKNYYEKKKHTKLNN